ncbi:MAG: hypothetical protein QMD14_03705 [Candidatus Aenigmarchaeota archaeon]|nr:hypothetical protein [Candidatus Aenigmarchaeota archaeon]
MIVEMTDEKDIDDLESKGCYVRYRLMDMTSLDCPESIISTLNVRGLDYLG